MRALICQGATSRPSSLPTAILIMSVAVLMVACSRAGRSSSSPALGPRPSSYATLRVLEPQPGQVLPGPRVRVRLDLRGARVIPQTKVDLRPDEGHIHLFVDGKIVSMTYGTDQVIEVAPGTHLLQAEFVAADHLPFNPRILVVTTFTVQ
jgi:hypothetical protein